MVLCRKHRSHARIPLDKDENRQREIKDRVRRNKEEYFTEDSMLVETKEKLMQLQTRVDNLGRRL
jgi:hypothetical protein